MTDINSEEKRHRLLWRGTKDEDWIVIAGYAFVFNFTYGLRYSRTRGVVSWAKLFRSLPRTCRRVRDLPAACLPSRILKNDTGSPSERWKVRPRLAL